MERLQTEAWHLRPKCSGSHRCRRNRLHQRQARDDSRKAYAADLNKWAFARPHADKHVEKQRQADRPVEQYLPHDGVFDQANTEADRRPQHTRRKNEEHTVLVGIRSGRGCGDRCHVRPIKDVTFFSLASGPGCRSFICDIVDGCCTMLRWTKIASDFRLAQMAA